MKRSKETIDESGNADLRIPLARRRGGDGKPYYLAHLPFGTTVLVFTQCEQPVIVVKKTAPKKA
jgi:hypothetical protein